MQKIKVWQSGENQPFLIMNCTEFIETDENIQLVHEDFSVVIENYSFYEVEKVLTPIEESKEFIRRVKVLFEKQLELDAGGYRKVIEYQDYILYVNPDTMKKVRLYLDGTIEEQMG
ncbi:MAG: hypothetical protein M0R32_11090 [Candidatus Cloacimonetes bacterium]|jgi:hypothetical protein|nr:hypothetical protein [Candidatus Cloacimonadota bacterium]